MLHFLKVFYFVTEITCFNYLVLLTLPMNWQDMYEVALERVKQLNKEIGLLKAILRSYLPIVKKDKDEKR